MRLSYLCAMMCLYGRDVDSFRAGRGSSLRSGGDATGNDVQQLVGLHVEHVAAPGNMAVRSNQDVAAFIESLGKRIGYLFDRQRELASCGRRLQPIRGAALVLLRETQEDE